MVNEHRSIEACMLLGDFRRDLIVAGEILQLAADKKQTAEMDTATYSAYRRAGLSQMLLTLLKWPDFLSTYKPLIPSDCIQACLTVMEELHQRRIQIYRNRCVGRVSDKKSGQALTAEGVDAVFELIFKNDEQRFLAWIGDPGQNRFPDTVLGVMQTTAEHIREANNLPQPQL